MTVSLLSFIFFVAKLSVYLLLYPYIHNINAEFIHIYSYCGEAPMSDDNIS